MGAEGQSKLMGTKYGCGIGECGSCTVHVDGKAVRSCTVSAGDMGRKSITTIEGLPESHPVKRAWVTEQVPQCGLLPAGSHDAGSGPHCRNQNTRS